jgi:hypothetical protein
MLNLIRFLRTHGGYSVYRVTDYLHPFGSSYLRGLFYCRRSFNCTGIVFSVPTEVIHTVSEPLLCILTIPCTYGGYSAELHLCSAIIVFLAYGGYSDNRATCWLTTHCSPYTRGLFCAFYFLFLFIIVFSVLTGVTPTLKSISINGKNFPRVTGVILTAGISKIETSSFLRTHGGYSVEKTLSLPPKCYSPYQRGLF